VAGGNCIEVAPLPGGGRAVRDSKAPGAGLLLPPPRSGRYCGRTWSVLPC